MTRDAGRSDPWRTAAFLALTGIVQLTLFFSDPRHFFQGDTVTWMYLRHRSAADFLVDFTRLDQGGWFRPLAQKTVQSVLFPLFGLNPIPYRLLTFAFFFACTVATFFLIRRLSGNALAAYFGTLFFAAHITHAYTTYDTAFTPEILYTLFAICSALAFLAFSEHRRNKDLLLSILFLVLSLMSKETAVTTPLLLLLVQFSRAKEQRPPLLRLMPHFLILAAYLAFVVGYLHVGSVYLSDLIRKPLRTEVTDYEMTATGLLPNAGRALNWSFNLPGTKDAPWRFPEPWMPVALQVFRIGALLILAAALFTPQRRLVLLGLGWFWIVLMPALPLAAHFLAYYLFGPLVGLSLAIGVASALAFERLSGSIRHAAVPSAVAVFGMLIAINANAAWPTAYEQPLLGKSARTNENAIANLRAMHPRLKTGVVLAVVNEDFLAISWSFGNQGLFRMAFGDDTIKTAITATPEDLLQKNAIALRFGIDSIEDVSKAGLDKPLLAFEPDAQYTLELSRSEVRAGGDFYVMRIAELPNASITVLYKTPAGNTEFFRTQLDGNGAVRFDVGAGSPLGPYVFLAVRPDGRLTWRKVEGTVRIR
jgi:hypothetical protein